MKTNNSFLRNKAEMRINHLPDSPSVLDCFGGAGLVWACVQRETGRRVKYVSIDKIDNGIGFYMPGDNVKYLEGMDLSRFNVVDLDSYGVPFEQLDVLFRRGYVGRVFVTFIHNSFGIMPHGLLREIGFTDAMIHACPTIFSRRREYFIEYLAKKGVREIAHRSHARNMYLTFTTAAPLGRS